MNAMIAQFAPLVATWMLLAALSTSVLALAATVVHRLVKGAVANRMVWGVAVLTAFALTFSQPWRRSAPPREMPMGLEVSASPSSTAVSPTQSLSERARAWLTSAGGAVSASVRDVGVATAESVRMASLPVQWALVLAWPLATVALIGIGAYSYRRQSMALRSAETAHVGGEHVHLSEAFGPAVFGVIEPRIVVPHWLRQRSADEQRLVVLHERSHINAHDPLLLLGSSALVAIMPWNAAAWYLLSRLRLAIELDCDQRVLQAGTAPRPYGTLLIDLSAASSSLPLPAGASAFSHRASHLERRLRTMTDRPTSHRTARRLAAASLAVLAIAGACGAELPTSAELEGMDVAAAEKRAFVAVPDLSAAHYVVDGKQVSEAEAKMLKADRIASIDIRKRDKRSADVLITTQGEGTKLTASRIKVGSGPDTSNVVVGTTTLRAGKAPFDGLLFVDGVKTDPAAMSKINPNSIESVEVIKGAAAAQKYGAEGAKGVIVITTKK